MNVVVTSKVWGCEAWVSKMAQLQGLWQDGCGHHLQGAVS